MVGCWAVSKRDGLENVRGWGLVPLVVAVREGLWDTWRGEGARGFVVKPSEGDIPIPVLAVLSLSPLSVIIEFSPVAVLEAMLIPIPVLVAPERLTPTRFAPELGAVRAPKFGPPVGGAVEDIGRKLCFRAASSPPSLSGA